MEIKNKDIYVRRGEECALKVSVKVAGQAYSMRLGDRIQLIVKRFMLDEEKAVISRTAIGSDVIHLRTSDTANLACGKYRYEVRLIKSDGGVHILVEPNNFIVTGGRV